METTRRRFAQVTALGGAALAAAPSLAPAEVAKATYPLKILILGGTGFIGPHQVRHALARGHRVTLFNRGKQPQEWPGEVEELLGDRNTGDLKALEGRDWDVCIDNPTSLPFWVRDAGKVLAGHVGQYIFISTISVYAANDAPADETTKVLPYEGQDPMAETLATFRAKADTLYGPLKAVSEAEAARRFPGKTTIIRPGLIVGPGDETDRFTYWPVRLDRGGEVLAPSDGSDPVQFIDARDLAEWTVRMAETRTLGVFNATGPARVLTTKAMLEGIGKGVRSTARPVWVSTKFLDDHKVAAWSDLLVWVPGQGDTAGFARRKIDRALKAGLTFRLLETTAAETLAWFKTQLAARQATLKAGLTAAREAELLGQWKAARG